MDAVEFMKEWQRMCDVTDCDDCQIKQDCKCGTEEFYPYYIRGFENIVNCVEQWSKEHPRKTRAQDFFEKHPNARPFYDGNPKACAAYCGYCTDCRADDNDFEKRDCYSCWNQPIE